MATFPQVKIGLKGLCQSGLLLQKYQKPSPDNVSFLEELGIHSGPIQNLKAAKFSYKRFYEICRDVKSLKCHHQFRFDKIMVMSCSFGKTLVTSVPAPLSSADRQHSEFDNALKCRWKEAADSAVCFYRLDRLQNKVIAGKFGFVAQYNPEKSKPGWRRPAQHFQKVNHNFDPTQFNFNQVSKREIIMGPEELLANSEEDEIDTFLLINKSPIEFGSCLLVPRMTQNIPQLITLHGLEILLKTVLLSTDPHLKAGFSSAGGCASVNHQHYHVYYLKEQLYLETSPVEHVAGPCFALVDYPGKGFAFQLDDNNDPALLARHVFTLADYMKQNEMAHNMFITRGKRFQLGLSADDDVAHYEIIYDTLRVFLWAREPAFGMKKDYGSMNPALCELGGHLLTTDSSEYEALTEEVVSSILQNMTTPWFQRVLPKIPLLFHDTF